jgi:arylsulfatase A-like enzyme
MSSRNFVFIVVDCLRSDYLGCYNAQGVVTPTIDRLAAEGVLFEQAIAQGYATRTAMPTVLSGCYPSAFGGFKSLTNDRPSLPGVLKSLKYQTAAFVPNPYLSKVYGYQLGFDHFSECLPRLPRGSNKWNSLLVRGINRLFGRWGIGIECPPYLNAKAVTKCAIQWLEQTTGRFFLWIHYMDAHTPYNLQRCAVLLPQGKGQRPYEYGFWRHYVQNPAQVTLQELAIAQQLYKDGLAFVDEQIKHLRQALQNFGYLEQTTFVITADHGEGFREHGLFGHPNHLYEESIHIPLIIAPIETAARRRISAQVRHLDLAPTLIELAGGTPPPAMQGVSLMPLVRGKAPVEPLSAISQTVPWNEFLVSLREFPWKLIWGVEPRSLQTRSVELYRLDDDPGERRDLTDVYPEKVAQMQTVLREHMNRLDLTDYVEQDDEEFAPIVLERLRALGYIDD